MNLTFTQMTSSSILKALMTLTVFLTALPSQSFAEQNKRNTIPADEQTLSRLMAIYAPPVITKDNQFKLPQLKQNLKNKKVVLVGEIHNQFEQHLVQLGVLKNLHEQNQTQGKKLGIGIEWIQSHFQPVVNDYLNDQISEINFLEQVEYAQRWGYDYRMFRPILSYAKQHKLPVYAIGTPQEINNKISKQGLESLTELEKAYIAPKIYPTSDEHLMKLEEHFSQYFSESKKIDNMVQINRLWESTMSHLTLKPIQQKQVDQMLVFTGINHISNNAGIVGDLSYNLPREKITTISVQTKGQLDQALTDYVVLSPLLYVANPKQVLFAKH